MKKKIAIVLDVKKYDWNGGINYFNNLINIINLKNYNFYIITGFSTKIDKSLFDSNFKFIKSKFCDPYSLGWFLRKIIFKIFQTDILLIKFLLKKKFEFVSHSISLGKQKKIKVINWIADLQPLILKNNYKSRDIKKHYNQFNQFLKFSDKLIFSSFTEKEKFERIYNVQNKKKLFVFKNIPKIIKKKKIVNFEKLQKKFNIKKNFFFIPNQFWKHKNHLCLFKAIKQLKKYNLEFIFSGNINDYRHEKYYKSLKNFIKLNNLKNNIKILGNISYNDVVSLIIHSKALINPSNYEGWSTSVEEAKIYKKFMILSDIDTHLEQVKNRNFFFKKNDYKSLKDKILYFSKKKTIKHSYAQIQKNYYKRTLIKKNQIKNIYV